MRWLIAVLIAVMASITVCLPSGSSFEYFGYSVTGLDHSGIAEVEAIGRAYLGISGRALVVQEASGNHVEEQNVYSVSVISNSLHDNRGIVSVNQNSGNVNNQLNLRVLNILQAGPNLGQIVQEAEAWGVTRRTDNTVIVNGGVRETRLANSVTGTIGIVGINQSSGSLNNQANVLVLALGTALDTGMALLGDSVLRDVNSGNVQTQGAPASRTETIVDSFTNFRGIAQVTQSSGDVNSIGNYLGISAQVMNIR